MTQLHALRTLGFSWLFVADYFMARLLGLEIPEAFDRAYDINYPDEDD